MVVPGEYLAKVVKKYRAELRVGVPPAGLRLDSDKVAADLLLLPTLAKTSKGWLVTASVVNLKTLGQGTACKVETVDGRARPKQRGGALCGRSVRGR
jgi:hypothetical protein